MKIDQLLNRGLSLEKLNAFLKVVRSETVTAAAEGNQSKRSLMSRQIGELEKTLGVELFHRTGKRLVLTEVGRKLALLTANYFNETEDLLVVQSGGERTIRFGAGESALDAIVFPKIRKIRERLSKTKFDFVSRSTPEILEEIKAGILDAGLVRSDVKLEGFLAFNCPTMDFVAIARKDYDRKIENYSLSQFLDNVPLVLIRGEGRFVSSFYKMCRELDVSPGIEARTESFSQVRALLQGGCAGAIIPRVMAEKLSSTDYRIWTDEKLRILDRRMVLIIDSRVARVRDSMETEMKILAEILS